MSATLSNVEQKVYNKVMASKKKAMNVVQIEAAIPGLSKKELNTAINNILRLKLFTTTKGKDDKPVFHAVAVEDAKKQNTLTEEQQVVLSIIQKAANKGITRQAIANQISTEVMPRTQVIKAVDSLEKSGLVKSFKSVNAPTMPLYILAHLKPPEDLAGGVWFDENKEYDASFVDTLRKVILDFVEKRAKSKDSISKLCPNPIYPMWKTPSLPTPQDLLRYIQQSKITNADLTVKNVMEISRALELDGLIEAIKPMGGVSIEPQYGSEDDEPVSKRHKSRTVADDSDDEERDRRRRKDKEKMKAKLKEKKRDERRKEREREQRAKEKERERRRKEKEKEKRRKAKEQEKRRKAKKEKDKKRRDRERRDSDVVDSDDELRELGDDEPVKKRKRRVESPDGSDSEPVSTASDSSGTDSDSDSDSDLSSDDDSDVSSIASDDIGEDMAFKSQAGGTSGTAGISSNPFFAADGRQTLVDLSDQAVVYRATRRLTIPLGEMQAPCGNCPQFNFCEEDGPVNPSGCSYFTDWLAGTNGGWSADVKAEKAAKAKAEDEARKVARGEVLEEAAEAGDDYEGQNGEANGEGEGEVYEEGGYDDYEKEGDTGMAY